MEWKFPIGNFQKFGHSSWGCALFYSVQIAVPFATENFLKYKKKFLVKCQVTFVPSQWDCLSTPSATKWKGQNVDTRLPKFHKPIWSQILRVQFVGFEKFTRVYLFQIAPDKSSDYLLIIHFKKVVICHFGL